jgi:hypothetical protein
LADGIEGRRNMKREHEKRGKEERANIRKT